MAHECPECGQMCYCGSDIDDCLLNCEEDVVGCTHCCCRKCGALRGDCDCFPVEEFIEDD